MESFLNGSQLSLWRSIKRELDERKSPHPYEAIVEAHAEKYEQFVQLKKKSKPVYIYMLTFTISPGKHPLITRELEELIENYIKSQFTRKALRVCEAHYVKEHHKDGRPHWHVSVQTECAIKKSLFTYYQQKYGNIDFSRTKGKTVKTALTYMSKENIPIKIEALHDQNLTSEER